MLNFNGETTRLDESNCPGPRWLGSHPNPPESGKVGSQFPSLSPLHRPFPEFKSKHSKCMFFYERVKNIFEFLNFVLFFEHPKKVLRIFQVLNYIFSSHFHYPFEGSRISI